MMVKIVAIALGFIAAVLSYPHLDKYMYALLALIVAVCIGVLVYSLVVRFLAEVLGGGPRI